MAEMSGIDIASIIVAGFIVFYFMHKWIFLPGAQVIVEQVDSLLLNFKYAKYEKLTDCMSWHHRMGLHETIELKGGWPVFPKDYWGN